jgi:heme/copper-type cytochrome/quinol oxidase subunit 2
MNKPPTEEEDERDRRETNIFLLVAAGIFIAVGIWLVNAMVDARKTEECLESGRRNCNPIEVPDRNR